jgi:glyoxylase-like metal-dependent hydrolase (beta-lactamase superfamily II)
MLQQHLRGGMQSLPSVPEMARLSSTVFVALGMNPSPFALTYASVGPANSGAFSSRRRRCRDDVTHWGACGSGTNTYLVGSGPKRVLIDAGEGRPEYIGMLERAIEQSGAIGLQEIIITHWHHDHLGGCSESRPLTPLLPPCAMDSQAFHPCRAQAFALLSSALGSAPFGNSW